MKIKFKLTVLGILTALLISLSLPSINTNEKAYANDGKGSTIAGIEVSGKKDKEIKKELQKAIESWKTEPVTISGGGSKLVIDSSKIEFDVSGTIKQYHELTDKPWYAFWKKKKVVHIPLQIKVNEEIKNEIESYQIWETEETYSQFVNVSSYLNGHEVEASVADLSVYENERLALAVSEIPDGISSVKQIAEVLDDYIVNPEEEFSFIEVIKEKVGNTDGKTLNFVASLLYSSILETEYEILERHQQNAIQTYVDPGREAKVSLSENLDLKFYNNSGHVAKIKATVKNNKLKIEIYSDVKTKNVTVTVEEEVVKPRIITRYSRKLAIGQSQLIQSSSEGLRVNVYRTVTGEGETLENLMNHSYYPPKNRIVLKSSRSTTTDSDVVNLPTNNEGNVDLDGDGLPDIEDEENTEDNSTNDDNLPPGSYYDKGGNLITP